jgi:hypothetical protein
MANYQTLKNSLKKLESHKKVTDQRQYSGVIYFDEYEKLIIPSEGHNGRKNKVGYLVVPRPLSITEWELEYAE